MAHPPLTVLLEKLVHRKVPDFFFPLVFSEKIG